MSSSPPEIPRNEPDKRWRRFLRASASPQLDLQLLGRTLLHAALVGAAAGLAGTLFFAALEFVATLVLDELAGYIPLRAHGEELIGSQAHAAPFRPWLLWAVPALGALAAGLISARFAPETLGGGSDAIIHAFHHQGGKVRRRVPFIKGIVSVLTLGTGGSGGREGPTMLIGGGIGSVIGRYLRVSEREQRILLVAGTAAGMAAVFRTPLGAALLAVEVLHRDDFESDAVVPAVLSSVVSYSVFISFFGESTLFAHAVRYPFVPAHLPLYALMAIIVSVVAAGFSGALHGVQRYAKSLSLPAWSKPALGGLLLGVFATPVLMLVGPSVGAAGQGLGILGGGYGVAQVAITGAPWFPEGWRGVELLLVLGLVKILATSLTVGSGGSAGDFGPSLVIGGIFGGAFGRTAGLLLHDPRIDPGAFALVGMATFYGGLAHVPIASLVMTCELAGSYDLLVPLMLAEGIAFVALRKRSLYHAQVPTKRESPAHRDDLIYDVLKEIRVGDVMGKGRPYITFSRQTPAQEVIRQIASSAWQDAFPVLDEHGKLAGIVNAEVMRTMAADPDLSGLALADDMMAAPVSVHEDDDLHVALEVLLSNDARELIVLNDGGHIVGFLDEAEITKTYHGRCTTPARPR
ncbi:chloride channel protein [Pendulispora albinea]|uniref:Chloride channel protein n=1 Tax=Pendulispora albinea TaxID=2741071 RepID=A0ABZ2LWV5_9BACT